MTAASLRKWIPSDRFPFAWIALFVLLAPSVSLSAEWRVNPIRLDFGREAKSGVITVFNEQPDNLAVQMKAMEWTQDSEGKDVYADSNDIVYFPRIIRFEKEGERIIRAGTRSPGTAKEKTYRLFIEEIPGPRKADGVGVAIALRIGVPIFVKPLKEEQKGEIGPVAMSKGVVSVPVKNTGNVHFVVQSVALKGKSRSGEVVFSRELSGWYLLAGASRRYETSVPAEVCGNLASVEVEVKAGKIILNGKVDADQATCAP